MGGTGKGVSLEGNLPGQGFGFELSTAILKDDSGRYYIKLNRFNYWLFCASRFCFC